MSRMLSTSILILALLALPFTVVGEEPGPSPSRGEAFLPPIFEDSAAFGPIPRPSRGSAAPVVAGFLASEDPSVRLRGIEAMDVEKSAVAIETLLRALYDDSAPVRLAAARRLGEASPAAVIHAVTAPEIARPVEFWETFWQHVPEWGGRMGPALTGYLSRDDITGDQGALAAHALGLLRHGPAATILAQRAWVQHPELAYRASAALIRLGELAPREEHRRLLRHPLREVRMAAVHAVALHGNQEALDQLHAVIAGQTERSMDVRREAIAALTRMEPRPVLPVLVDLYARVPSLNIELRHALIAVAGLDNGPNPGTWRAWYEALLLYESGQVGEANRRLEALQNQRSVRLR
jgi:hypothetical protein